MCHRTCGMLTRTTQMLRAKILGMLAPGGDGGLETFFRQVGVCRSVTEMKCPI